VVCFQDPSYPARLKEIFDPPILLYAMGNVDLLQTHSVAVVGTRRPTPYGQAVAQKISREVAEAGLTVVSGLARGIDTFAHRGALEAAGGTIAVLGSGVNVVYPRENEKLAAEICKRGLLISEFPMGTTAFPQNFPLRNRTISGVSYGVLVVEGAQYSGSLITARLALEQGREVFAIPGNIVSKQSWGPNLLIKDGAKLVQDANDIIEELPAAVRQELSRRPQHRERAGAGRDETFAPGQASLRLESTSPLGQKVLSILRVDLSQHIDEIIRGCAEASASEILSVLSELELYGAVKQLPGKQFVRVWC
jgi:DNA processing protein